MLEYCIYDRWDNMIYYNYNNIMCKLISMHSMARVAAASVSRSIAFIGLPWTDSSHRDYNFNTIITIITDVQRSWSMGNLIVKHASLYYYYRYIIFIQSHSFSGFSSFFGGYDRVKSFKRKSSSSLWLQDKGSNTWAWS